MSFSTNDTSSILHYLIGVVASSSPFASSTAIESSNRIPHALSTSSADRKTPAKSGRLFPLGIDIHDLRHSEYSTICEPSLVLSEEIFLRAPENTRSGSVGIGGIEKMLTASFDKDGKPVCCDS